MAEMVIDNKLIRMDGPAFVIGEFITVKNFIG